MQNTYSKYRSDGNMANNERKMLYTIVNSVLILLSLILIIVVIYNISLGDRIIKERQNNIVHNNSIVNNFTYIKECTEVDSLTNIIRILHLKNKDLYFILQYSHDRMYRYLIEKDNSIDIIYELNTLLYSLNSYYHELKDENDNFNRIKVLIERYFGEQQKEIDPKLKSLLDQILKILKE